MAIDPAGRPGDGNTNGSGSSGEPIPEPLRMSGQKALPGVEVEGSVKAVTSRSVIGETVQDVPKQVGTQPGSARSWNDSLIWFMGQVADEFETWGSTNSKLRDKQLRAFIGTESQFTSALGIIILRNSAFNWKLEGSPRTAARVHQILTEANMGLGWEDFVAKVSLDLYTQDHGAFIEIVRAGNSPSGALLGINHLDAARCWHTGDPLKPVIYEDVNKTFHLLDWWSVVTLSEMPTTIEGKYGLQFCAETRLLIAAQITKNISIYTKEKSGGRNTRAIHLVQGLTTAQVNDAIEDLKTRADTMGLQRYMQPVVIGSHDPQATLDVKTLELSGVPDDFDSDEAFRLYTTLIAMAFGTDYQEFAPLPGGNLGTSMQSQVLHNKSRGKGPGLFMKLITNAMNNRILPRNVVFGFEEMDIEAEESKALISKTRAETRKIQIESTEITPQESRQMAVDSGDLPQQIFESTGVDATPNAERVQQLDRPNMAGERELGVSPSLTPFGSETVSTGTRQTTFEPARAGPFEEDRLVAERRLTRSLVRAFATIFENIQKELRREKREESQSTTLLGIKAVGDLVGDEAFWGLQRAEFMAEVGGQPLSLLLEGGQQAQRLGLAVDMTLVNTEALQFTQQFTNRWWDELSAQTRNNMRTAISTFVETDQPLKVLNKNLEPLFGKARAEVIARTEVTRMYAEGNRIAYKDAGIKEVEWRTVSDALVDPVCIELGATNRNRMPLGQESVVPPAHPRCLPADTRIAAQSISASSERWYDGELITIRTAGGKQLSCTPNHPILTQSGWIAAGELDIGSYVISASGSYWNTFGDNKHQYMPPTIQEVTETFGRVRQVSTCEVPVSPEDFHSDGIGSKVATIRSDRLLVNQWDAALSKQGAELPFVGRDSAMSMPFLNRQGSIATLRKADTSSTGRDMSGHSLLTAFGDGHSRPLESFGGASPTRGNAVVNQPLADRPTIDPVSLGQLILGDSAEVTLDQIIDRKASSFHGYVYNLQTESGAYLAEGIVTHNCRCWLAPVVDDKVLATVVA